MLALFPTKNTLLFMRRVRHLVTNEVDEKKHLNGFSVVSLIVAAYLMVVIIIENAVTLNSIAHIVILLFLVILLVSPLYIAIKAQRMNFLQRSRISLPEEDQLLDAARIHITQAPTKHDDVADGATKVTDIHDKEIAQTGENLNVLQAMCALNLWFLFLTTASGMGSGLATVNSLSQIGGSLGYTNYETSTLVSLWSIWNYLGRFGAGYVSDYFLHMKGWARPLFIAITLAIMSVGHCVIASGLPSALYIGSVLVGVCYGSQWCLMPTIASEIFGVTHFGTIFNTITIAGPLGSYVLSVSVIGYFYDKEASHEGNKCMGTHCFRSSFFIMASTTFLGSLFALGLFFRTRTLYEQVVLRRLRISNRD